jgi:hypothetical protein
VTHTNSIGAQRPTQLAPVPIVPQAADHAHPRTQARRGYRLIGALAATGGAQPSTEHRLAAARQSRRLDH